MARTKKVVKTKTTPKQTTGKKAPVKKTPTKKVAKKVTIKKPDLTSPIYGQILKIVGIVIAIVGIVTLLDLGVQYLNNDYSVAVVNGQRISKAKWHKTLENAYGASIADTLINDTIIEKEAKKMEVDVTDEEIQEKLDTVINRIGGEEAYQAALKASNVTEKELKEQLKNQLLYTKVIGPEVKYTDDDLKEFFNQYSSIIFPTETAALAEGEQLDFEKYKEETKEQYLISEVQTMQADWLSTKKAEYKIQDNSTAKPKYGFLKILGTLFKK
jgi:preprotein translocase subunit Sss1